MSFSYFRVFIFTFLICVIQACNHSAKEGSVASINEVHNAEHDELKVLSSHDITFTKSHTIKGDSVNFIGYMGNFTVDHLGNVYVMSGGIGSDQRIFVYGPSGQLKDKIGGKGRGPGEFEIITNIDIRSDTLYAYDYILKRFSLFSINDLELIDTIIQDSRALGQPDEGIYYEIGSKFYPLKGGDIILRIEENYLTRAIKQNKGSVAEAGKADHYYYRMDGDGNVDPEPIYQVTDNRFGKAGPYRKITADLPHTLNYGVTFDPEGRIYSTPSDSLQIRIKNMHSKEQSVIRFPFKNADLDPERIIDHYEYPALKEIAESADLPDKWPAINKFLLDDEDRIWVSTITSSYDKYEWWIIEEEELIAKFSWPGNKLDRGIGEESIKAIKNGKIYTYELEEGGKYIGEIVVYDYSITRK